jgi:hypothetical protein
MLYILNRPSVMESVIVSANKLVHDSGTPDFLESGPNALMMIQRRSPWAMFTRKRRVCELTGLELTTLKLMVTEIISVFVTTQDLNESKSGLF